MRTKLALISAALTAISCSTSMADLINKISYRPIGSLTWENMEVDSSGTFARTDQVIDSSTVEAVMWHNPTDLRWELVFRSAQTQETSLGASHDINVNYELNIEAQIFDESFVQSINSVKVMGDLQSFKYDESFDTATFQIRPRDLTPSLSYPSGKSGVLMTYFSYSGNSAAHPEGLVDYGNAIIESNVWIDDLGYTMHNSSSQLWGSGFSVDGLANTEAEFNLYTQKSYAEQSLGGMYALGAGGYIDGYVPQQNFNYSVGMEPEEDFCLTTLPQQNDDDDDVVRYSIGLSYDFSNRDFQIGYFNTPWLGSTLGDGGWQFLDWLDWFKPSPSGWVFHGKLGWMFAPANATYDNMFLFHPTLGWIYTNSNIYPFMYVYNYQEDAFWAFFFKASKSPNVFYRYDSGQLLYIP